MTCTCIMPPEKRTVHPHTVLSSADTVKAPSPQCWGMPETWTAVMGRNFKMSYHHCSADSCQNTQQWHPQAHWVLKQSTLFFYSLANCFPRVHCRSSLTCSRGVGRIEDHCVPGGFKSLEEGWRGANLLSHSCITIFWCSSDSPYRNICFLPWFLCNINKN